MNGTVSRAAPTTGGYAIVGAEIHYGTDRTGLADELAEPYLAELLAGARSVLFAGAHDPAVVARAIPGRDVTVQVGRVPDAESGRYPGARVLCGAIDRVEGGYDLVVALGGLERAGTPDAPLADAAASLASLAARVGPQGTLVVATANAFGLARINALAARAERADPYATGHDALRRVVAAAGLVPVAGIAVYPDLAAASLLVHRDLLDEPADRDIAGLLVGAAFRGRYAEADAVSDPRRLARDAVAHGLAYHLAPGWILVARRPAAAEPFVAVVAVSGGPGMVPLITERAGGCGPYQPGTRMREWRPERTLPRGALLSERITDAASRNDLPAIRGLLIRYSAWLDAAAQPGATPGNVVDDGSDLHLLASATSPPPAVSPRATFLAGLAEVAAEMQSAGLRHPWPATLTAPRLAARLAAAAGLTVSEDEIVAAVPAPRESAEDGDAAPEGPMGTLARPSGYAEAVRLATDVSRELAEARAQLRFLAETLADRDDRLRAASTAGRVSRLLKHPMRTVGRRLRS